MNWEEVKQASNIYDEELDHIIEEYRIANNMREVPAEHKVAVYISYLLAKIELLEQDQKRNKREFIRLDQIIKARLG